MLIGVIGLKYDLFVRLEADPGEAFEDGSCRLIGRPSKVCVLDAKKKFAAFLPGKKIVEECGPGGSDMKITRRRRCKSDSN
jgi:hypothetical protein